MALFKISRGKSANLPANKVNGYCYVTIDEHKLYVDYTKDDGTLDRFALNAVSADQWKTARNLNGMVVNGTSNVVNYGTCSTAAATVAKVVSCSNFALITGAEITVKFTTTNTAANPTLNVNNTGAKAIYYKGSAISAGYLAANRTYTFRYNGTQYELVGDLNTDTKNTAGSTDTSNKIYLIGATSQGANPQTYSHDTVYVDTGGCVVSNGYRLGLAEPFFKAGLKTSKSYTFPAETSKTYYVVLKNNSSFDEQKFMFRTSGNNTNHMTLAVINARPYMGATIYGQTLRYNGPEISNIAVYKNVTASYKHDVVLTVKTNPTTTTILYVNSDGDFDLSSECISTTAPTGTVEASFNPSYDDRLFTTSPIYAGGGFTGNLSGNAATASKLATARTISLTGDITGSGSFDGSDNLSITTTRTSPALPTGGTTGQVLVKNSSTDGDASWVTDISGNAATATKATQDSDGSQINTTYVKKSGSEMSSLNALTASTSTTTNITPNANAVASSPFARDLWHDHFAFLSGGHIIRDHQTTTDGSTWTNSTLDLAPLFMQKESLGITILETTELARKFTIECNNFAYSSISWYEIGVGYSSPFSQFEIYIETSNDNSNWSQVHKSTITSNSSPFFLKGNNFGANKYLRFTFTKKTNTTTGTVCISCIKAYTSRKANQGRGIEYEYPYDWNSSRDIFPHTDNARQLGLSNRRWTNVYATTFTGNLSGNASTATKVYTTSTNPSTGTTYTIPFIASTSNGNQSLLDNNGIGYWTKEGTTTDVGTGELKLGNSTASGTAGNKKGMIYMYGTSSGYTEITPTNNTTSNININLPSKAGTIALTSDNVATATKLQTARTISLTGSVTGSGTFDGSNNLSITTTTNHTHSYLPLSGGTVTGDLTIQKTSTISANSPATLNFKTVQSDNNVTSSAYIRVYDDHDTAPHGTNMVIQSSGNIIIGSGESPSACYNTDLINSASENMYITSDNNIYFYTNCNTYADKKTSVYINNAGALYGAVWNDYAEFRICKDNFKPGQVVLENGDDTLSIASQRLQRGCSITSDTFGFAIGETDKAKCPIAVSGRVLAYGYESREEFAQHIGWPVCSGPNGTVSIMTEEEEEKYPSRIIGTISAVPDYETWGTGNVSVNGRIWIKIR